MGMGSSRSISSGVIKVILVDDDQVSLDVTEAVIRHHFDLPVSTQTFKSGRDVLDHLETSEDTPQLFITDFQMPGMNGAELLAQAMKLIGKDGTRFGILTSVPERELPHCVRRQDIHILQKSLLAKGGLSAFLQKVDVKRVH